MRKKIEAIEEKNEEMREKIEKLERKRSSEEKYKIE
jgi:hypothetical protein